MAKKRILILYQGDDANQFVTETLAYLTDKKHGDFEPVKLSSGMSYFDANLFCELLNMIQKSDFAIGLFTLDERLASEAGNLWLEIGCWWCLKPTGSIFITAQEHEKVKPPSNIAGQVIPRFKNTENLKRIISEFCSQMNQFPSNNIPSSLKSKKIQDTLLDGKEQIQVENLFRCRNTNKQLLAECAHKENLYSSLSELLRIAKSNEEHNFIQYYLLEISGNILELKQLKLARLPRTVLENHSKECFKKVRNILMDMRNFADRYLQRADNSHSPLDKLKEYFTYRLLSSYKKYGQTTPPEFLGSEDYKHLLAKKQETFFYWYKDFLSNSHPYMENYINYIEDLDKPEFPLQISNMYDSSEYALIMSKILFDIGNINFKEGYTIFKTISPTITEPNIIFKLEEIWRELPHNQLKVVVPRVWPRSPEEKLADDKIIQKLRRNR